MNQRSTDESTAAVSAVLGWLTTYAAQERRDAAEASWRDHQVQPKTVLTLLGVYDSGKSSLLRRLLVDAGQACPSWLTVSARHETFEVAPIEVLGIVVRDTPGLSPTARDPRGQQNNRRALEAAALTDVLVLVVPPQLATGEVDELQAVLNQYWSPGSLRCVISRFDEAGVDPNGDPAQYAALAIRKAAELRRSLRLSADVPVHVVAPDAWQFAGEAQQPEPSVWDHSRDWDGMSTFEASLLPLATPVPAYRAAAGSRFWSAVLKAEVQELEARQRHVQGALATANQASRRNEQIVSRLDELESGVRAELAGALSSVLDMALQSGVADAGRLRDKTTAALDIWLRKAQADLRALMQDVGAEFERQTARTTWQDLDDAFDQVASDHATPAASDGEGTAASPADTMRPRLLEVNRSLAKSLKEVRDVFAKRTSDFSASAHGKPAGPRATKPAAKPGASAAASGMGRADTALQAGEVLVALGPALVEMFGLISDLKRDQAQQRAQREALASIERKLNEFRTSIGEAAFAAVSEDIQAARAVVEESAAPVRDLECALREQAALLEEALTQAALILADIVEAGPEQRPAGGASPTDVSVL